MEKITDVQSIEQLPQPIQQAYGEFAGTFDNLLHYHENTRTAIENLATRAVNETAPNGWKPEVSFSFEGQGLGTVEITAHAYAHEHTRRLDELVVALQPGSDPFENAFARVALLATHTVLQDEYLQRINDGQMDQTTDALDTSLQSLQTLLGLTQNPTIEQEIQQSKKLIEEAKKKIKTPPPPMAFPNFPTSPRSDEFQPRTWDELINGAVQSLAKQDEVSIHGDRGLIEGLVISLFASGDSKLNKPAGIIMDDNGVTFSIDAFVAGFDTVAYTTNVAASGRIENNSDGKGIRTQDIKVELSGFEPSLFGRIAKGKAAGKVAKFNTDPIAFIQEQINKQLEERKESIRISRMNIQFINGGIQITLAK